MRYKIIILILVLFAGGAVLANSKPVKTFTRTGTVYLDATAYTANQERTITLPVPSISDGTVILGGGTADVNVYPQCVYNGVMYGIGAELHLYTSTNGTTWALLNSTTHCNIIHVTSDGNMIGITNGTTGVAPIIYHSTDLGVSFTQASGITIPTTSKFIPWSIASHGAVVMISEYKKDSNDLGRYIYRSTDGAATWNVALDSQAVPFSTTISHWHTLGYHAGASKWVAFSGDGLTKRLAVCSADNGATWALIDANLCAIGNFFPQPASLYDNGHATRIYFGDDGSLTAGWIDVNTGVLGRLGEIRGDGRANAYRCWSLTKVNGIWYAGGVNDDTTGLTNAPCIFVSSNGENWVVYHQFLVSDNLFGASYYAGFIGGKLHYILTTVSGSNHHFAISPVTLTNRVATVVMPATTNLLTANNPVIDDGISDWATASSATVSRQPVTDMNVVPYLGAGCVKVVGGNGDPSDKSFVSQTLTGTEGVTYTMRCRMKATNDCTVDIKWYKKVGGTTWTYVSGVSEHLDSTWRDFTSNSYTCDANTTIRVYFAVNQGSKTATVFVDNAQTTITPSKLWTNTTATNPDSLTYAVKTSTIQWTDSFTVQPLSAQQDMTGSGSCYVKTWKFDASNYVSLYYDAVDGNFALATVNAGGAAVITKTPIPAYWQAGNVFKITFTSNAAGVSAVIRIAKNTYTVATGAAVAAINGAAITMLYGDITPANQLPMYVFVEPFLNRGFIGFDI